MTQHAISDADALLKQYQLVPVAVIEDAQAAAPLGEALIAGGLPCIEVTFRTSAAPQALQTLAGRDDMWVGAGTVINVDQCRQAIDAGAQFIVSPGLSRSVVECCQQHQVPVLPGVSNPSDIMAAIELGLKTVKFFPAEQLGGVKMLKALAAPFPQLQFVPTGGINADNVGQYLAMPPVVACGGSWMVKPSLYEGGDFSEVTRLTREAVAALA
jgi:2-dehydro-3-deoxyphosphogluconate aldolase/(4S)-4-hydroxy-2-oxoglutarate aldolase